MPRSPKHTVPRINPVVLATYFKKRPQGKESDYYVLEKGQHAISGCALRVRHTQIQIGIRKGKFHPVATIKQGASVEDVEGYREACRRKARELEDEDLEPSLKTGRNTTWEQGYALWRQNYLRRRSGKRSPRTLEWYDDLFQGHVLPLYGKQTLSIFAALTQAELEAIPLVIAERVRLSRPWASGVHTGNHALKAMRMVWDGFRRQGWVAKDPFLDIEEVDAPSAKVYLEDADLAAVGQALRLLEAEAAHSKETTRQIPSLRSLLALRVVLYTGCRHVEELCKAKLSWLREDFGFPRLEIPRAKGERGDRAGRVLYLGPDALRCLREMPRPEGCEDLVPGRVPGTQTARLTEPWERVLLEARKILEAGPPAPSSILKARIVGYQGERRVTVYEGSLRVPVKATRHTLRTIIPRAGINPDHGRQLLGHEAASLGDRVYLHEHGPSLSQAAGKAEEYIRRLMGDLEDGVLRFRRGA
jgi:integrase